LWLLCAGGFLQAATPRRQFALAAATSGCACWLWAAHGRMIVAVALSVALFALMLWRRIAWRPALVGLAVVGVGLVAVHVLDHFLVTHNWDGHARNELTGRLSTVESAGGIGAFLRNLVGQSWYLAVASLGVLLAAALPVNLRALRLRFAPAHIVLALTLLTGI